jgi:hypothetical protein
MRRTYQLPTQIAWPDELSSDVRARLQSVIQVAIRQVIDSVAGRTAQLLTFAEQPDQVVGERFSSYRRHAEDATYAIPSYQDGGAPVQIPLHETGDAGIGESPAGSVPPPTDDRPTRVQVAQMIREHFPATQGLPGSDGVLYGVYLTQHGAATPRLYYLVPGAQGGQVRMLRIARHMPDRIEIISYPAGTYTLIARPHSPAQLYAGSRRLDDNIGNPENVDVAVNFFVPAAPDEYTVTVRAPRRFHFYPRLRILRTSDDNRLATGAETVYLADVEIWRVDDQDNWSPVFGLALIYAFVSFQWTIWRLERPREGGAERRVRVRSQATNRAFLTHQWTQAGEYEIECTVALHYEDASPRPVTERRRDQVIALEAKMALELAQLEQREHQPGATPIWFESASGLLEAARARLRTAEQAPQPNEAIIRSLREAVAQLERQLVHRTSAGPFPLRAIFTERRTGETRPISLFIGPASTSESGYAHTWYLIDLTYPAFYRTYTGNGQSVGEAVRAAFEAARSSFRGNYPPGRILARIEWPGMEQYGLHSFDFAIETESWQRTAYEWLTLGASALAMVGLAAALIFPPTSVVVGAIIITGAVAGAVVSAINIAERINTNSFEWDSEAAVDLINIATAFTMVGGMVTRAATRGVATGISRAIAAGEPVTISAVSRLVQLVRFQRAILYMDLTAHLSNGLLISYDTYAQLRDVDAAMSSGTLMEYQRIYGHDEGQRRWETERFTRILGVLARAATNGLLTLVSIRGARQALAERNVQLRQPRVPGAERPVSARLGITPGQPMPAFPQAQFDQNPAAFRRAEIDGVIRRLGLPAGDAVAERLSPQAAWQINTALDVLTETQRTLLLQTLRAGSTDLPDLRRFLNAGGNLQELASFLEIQPALIRDGIGTFQTLQNRFDEFRRLARVVPDLHTFHWDPANLEAHFRRHVLGEAGYTDEAWQWAHRLGIADAYGLDHAGYQRLLTSTAVEDVARRQHILTNYQQAYGDYIHTVLARSNVFVRSGRGADLVGSDGDLIWFASENGVISSGYLPANPTVRGVGAADDLQGIFLNAVREGQSVFLLFRAQL